MASCIDKLHPDDKAFFEGKSLEEGLDSAIKNIISEYNEFVDDVNSKGGNLAKIDSSYFPDGWEYQEPTKKRGRVVTKSTYNSKADLAERFDVVKDTIKPGSNDNTASLREVALQVKDNLLTKAFNKEFKSKKPRSVKEVKQAIEKANDRNLIRLLKKVYEIAPASRSWMDLFNPHTTVDTLKDLAESVSLENTKSPLVQGIYSAIEKLGIKSFSLRKFARVKQKEEGFSSWDDRVFEDTAELTKAIDKVIGNKSLANGIALKFKLFKDTAAKYVMDHDDLQDKLAVMYPLNWIMPEENGETYYEIPNHMLFSMFVNADNWMTTVGLQDPLPNEEAAAEFFYGDSSYPLHISDLNELKKHKHFKIGNTFSSVVELLGKNIVADTGLRVRTTDNFEQNALNARVFADLEMAAGGFAIDILEKVQSDLHDGITQVNPDVKDFPVFQHDREYQLTILPHEFTFEFDDPDTDREAINKRRYKAGDKPYFINAFNLTKLRKETITYQKEFADRNKAYGQLTSIKGYGATASNNKEDMPAQDTIKPKRSRTNPSPEIQKTAYELSQMPWYRTDAFDPLIDIFEANPKIAIKLREGIVDINELATRDQELLENKNIDITTDFENLQGNRNTLLTKPIYIPHGIMSNYRIFQRGSITPQNSHVHRIAMRSHGKTKYGTNKGDTDINFFKFAVVFNMKVSPDKLTTKEILTNFDRIIVDKVVTDTIDVYDGYVDGTKTSADLAKAIDILMDKYDPDPSLVAGIVALSQYRKANGKSFESDISYEVDGITNGYAISLLQYPFTNDIENQSSENPITADLQRRLKQIGVYLEKDISNNDFESFLLTQQDLYTDLAQTFTAQLEANAGGNIEFINFLFDNQFAVDGTAISKIRNIVKYPTMIYMYGGGAPGITRNTLQELIRDAQVKIVRKRLRYNKLANINKESRTKAQQNEIANLGKELTNIDTAISTLKGGGRYYIGKSDLTGKQVSIGTLTEIDPHTKEEVEVSIDIKNFNLSHDKRTASLRKNLQNVFQQSFQAALEQELGGVVAGRRTSNNVIELQTIVFTSKLNDRISAFIQEYGFTPADSTVLEIIKNELIEFFPSYKGPLDDAAGAIMDGLDMTSPKRVRSPINEYDTGIKNNDTAFATKHFNPVNSNSFDVQPSIIKFKEAGVRGGIIQIHNMDASIQKQSLDKVLKEGTNGLSLYDAFMADPKTALTTFADTYNEWFLKYAYEFDISTKSLESLKTLRELIKDEEQFNKVPMSSSRTAKELAELENMYITRWNSNWHRSDIEKAQTFQQAIDQQIRQLEANIASRKLAIEGLQKAGYESKQMFSHHMKESKNPPERPERLLTAAETADVTQELPPSKDDVLFSLEVEPENALHNDSLLTANKVTTRTAKGIFQTLSNISDNYYPDQASKEEHEAQLVKLFKQMMPVLAQLNGIKIDVNDVDSLTAGFASKHKNEITLNLTRNSTPPSMLAQTPTEVYTHETGHILITRVIKDNPILAKKLERALLNLQKQLKAKGGFEAFLPDNPTDADRHIAEMLYNYLLENPGNTENELAEFMMLGLTNRSYINALKQFKNPAPTRDGDSFLDHLIDLFNSIVDLAVRLVKGKLDNNAYQDLFDMAMELTESQYKAKTQMEMMLETTTKAQKQFNQSLTKYAKNAAIKVGEYEPTTKVGKAVRGTFGIAANVFDQSKTMTKFKETQLAKIPSDFIRDIFYEMKGVMTPKATALLLRAKHVVDKARRFEEKTVIDDIKKEVGKLSRNDDKALHEIILKADLSSLLTVESSLDDIRKALTDAKYRNKQKKVRLDAISKVIKHPELEKYMDEMAHYIMTGEIDKNIQDGYDSILAMAIGLKASSISDKSLNDMDVYVTLKSLEYVPEPSPTLMSKLNKDGTLRYLVESHAAYKQDVLDKLFDGDRYEMKKGYVRKKRDLFSSYKVGTAKDAATMKQLGYKKDISLGMLPGVNKDAKGAYQETFLYTSKFNPNNRLQSGIFSFTEFLPGHKLDFLKLDRTGDGADIKFAKKYLKKINQLGIKSGTNIRPIRTRWIDSKTNKEAQGITGYRITIPNETENQRFSIDTTFQNTFAHMKSSVVDQVNSRMINAEAIELLLEEQTLFDIKSGHFVDILDKEGEYYDYYTRMPKYTQKMFQQNKDENGKFYVRKEVINKILGYEKLNLATSLDIDMLKHPVAYRVLKEFGNVISYISHTAMGRLALGTTDVVIGNFMSNIYQLAIRGISPLFALRKYKEGYYFYNNYVKMYTKYHLLTEEVKRRNLSPRSEKAQEAAKLAVRLQRNPMHPYFEKGVNSMIVEDINEASTTGPIEYLGYKFENTKLGQTKAVKGLTTVAGEIYGSPNSRIFSTFKHFTAMTDMLSRYTMVEHAGAEAKKARKNDAAIKRIKDAELEKALEAFIVFDENLNPKLQLLSDLGVWWFARYFLRNQRVALQLIRENPAGVGAAAAIQTVTGLEAAANINSTIFAGRISPQLMQQLNALGIVTNPTYGLDQVLAIPDAVLP